MLSVIFHFTVVILPGRVRGTVTTQLKSKGLEAQGVSIHLPKWNQGIIDIL